MSLADQIIEHGPYPTDQLRTLHTTTSELNELRDELTAGRAKRDSGQLFEAWGLIGMARRIAREGEDDISNWATFEECAADYFRRRDEDAPSTAAVAPQSDQNGPSQGPGWVEALTAISGRYEIEAMDAWTFWISCDRCGWHAEYDRSTDLAELVRRAGEHAEVCR